VRQAAASALLVLALAACGADEQQGTVRSGPPNVVRIALTRIPWPLDPAAADDPDERTLARALVATPLRTDPGTGRLRPGLCSRWLSAEGGRHWRFRCRHARAIALALRRGARTPAGWPFAAATSIAATTGDELEVRLAFPWRRFSYALTMPVAAPQGVPGPFRVVTSGPRRLVAERPGLRLVFSRLTPREGLAAFRAGRVDVAPVPFGELGAVRGDSSLAGELRVRPLLAVDLVAFDLVGGPLASLPNTRRAYWLTADRADYAALVAERAGGPALGLVPGGGDEERAAPKLVRAQRERVASLPPVGVAVATDPRAPLPFAADQIVATWRDSGLGARVAGGAAGATLRRLRAHYALPEGLLAALLVPQDRTNPWRSRPSPARALLLRALAASDPRDPLARADAELARTAAVVPLAWIGEPRLVSRRLRGWRQDTLGDVDYARVRSPGSSRSP
jgi:hypothetical protein